MSISFAQPIKGRIWEDGVEVPVTILGVERTGSVAGDVALVVDTDALAHFVPLQSVDFLSVAPEEGSK